VPAIDAKATRHALQPLPVECSHGTKPGLRPATSRLNSAVAGWMSSTQSARQSATSPAYSRRRTPCLEPRSSREARTTQPGEEQRDAPGSFGRLPSAGSDSPKKKSGAASGAARGRESPRIEASPSTRRGLQRTERTTSIPRLDTRCSRFSARGLDVFAGLLLEALHFNDLGDQHVAGLADGLSRHVRRSSSRSYEGERYLASSIFALQSGVRSMTMSARTPVGWRYRRSCGRCWVVLGSVPLMARGHLIPGV
jgi:hypothetical protein